jgi:hypothetical protein
VPSWSLLQGQLRCLSGQDRAPDPLPGIVWADSARYAAIRRGVRNMQHVIPMGMAVEVDQAFALQLVKVTGSATGSIGLPDGPLYDRALLWLVATLNPSPEALRKVRADGDVGRAWMTFALLACVVWSTISGVYALVAKVPDLFSKAWDWAARSLLH